MSHLGDASQTTMSTGYGVLLYDVKASWKHLNVELIKYLGTLDTAADWTMIMLYYLQLAAKILQTTPISQVTNPTARQVMSASLHHAFTNLNDNLIMHLKTQDLTTDWTITMWHYVHHAEKIWLKLEGPIEVQEIQEVYADASTPSRIVDQEVQEIHANDFTPPLPPPISFIDLPPELRDEIYSYVVTPEMAEAHLRKNKTPALFKVSKRVGEDFARFYYGRKVFTAQFYDPSTSTWEEASDPLTVQALFENWTSCYLGCVPQKISWSKPYIEHFGEDIWPTRVRGIVTWVGGEGTEGWPCYFHKDAKRDIISSRLDRMMSSHARDEKWQRFWKTQRN